MPIRVRHILAVGRFSPARGLVLSSTLAFASGCILAQVLAIRVGAAALIPAYVLFGLAGGAIGVYDLRRRKVPNWMLMPVSFSITALLLVAAGVDDLWGAMLRGLCAALVVTFAFGTLAVVFRRGLGFGDVKLAGLIGLVTGFISWHTVWLGIVLGFLGAAIVGAVLLVRRVSKGTTIPFAPFMLLGATVAVCLRT